MENGCIEIINKSRTFQKWTPCGNLYIHIAFKEEAQNKVDFIIIDGASREIDCGHSWVQGLADLLTFSVRRIRNQHEADAIIKALRGHRCNKYLPNKEHTTSCTDAIAQVLQEVIGSKL